MTRIYLKQMRAVWLCQGWKQLAAGFKRAWISYDVAGGFVAKSRELAVLNTVAAL